jgi:hypothetical protein
MLLSVTILNAEYVMLSVIFIFVDLLVVITMIVDLLNVISYTPSVSMSNVVILNVVAPTVCLRVVKNKCELT